MARLADLDVLIVDCQSTGATPALGALLEMGWTHARASGGAPEIRAHRVALPEGTRIPRVVAELTGIRDAADDEALAPEEVWRRIRATAEAIAATDRVDRAEAPTVIHFARFELAFLRDLHARFEPTAPFPFDVVCVHEIARRLLPGLPRRNLRALAGYFGHGTPFVRRSAGHVDATAFVWTHVAAELEARGVTHWDELKAWLDGPSVRAPKRRIYPLERERRLALPDEPGVYRFLRTSGDVLYVGKATSLRKRVNSYFTKRRGVGERTLEMLSQARDLTVTVTPTALEAALLETDLIKALDPPYNVHLREGDRAAWFASRDLERIAPAPDDAHPLGPLPSRWSLAGFAALRAIAAGDRATKLLCARAVGAPLAFAPNEGAFAEGLRLFRERHLAPTRSRTVRGALLKASNRLWELGETPAEEEMEADARPTWDPERVCRHLERSALQGGQLLRRSRWLCLLSECTVAFCDARARSRRELVLVAGEIVERRDVAADEPLSAVPGSGRRWRERQASFDANRYDRLRILGTELKRIASETKMVAIRLSERCVLESSSVERVLRWV